MDSTHPDREESMLAQALEEIETQAAFHIESSGDEVVVRFRRGGLSDQQISRFLALLELDAIRQKSQLTEEDAMELADEVNRAAWEKIQRRFGLPG